MKKINKIIIILVTIVSYLIALYNIKNKLYVDVLICILVLPTMLLPYLLDKFNIKTNEKLKFIYLIFIFFAYFLGTVIDLYSKLENYDTLMHFISGIFTAYISLFFIKENNKLNNVLFILGFSSLVAILWEIFEYTSSIIFKVDPQNVLTTGINDTMKDMIVAVLGAIIVSVLYVRKSNYKIIKKKSKK